MSTRTITVDATERQSATPDKATITVQAIGGGRRPPEARETVRDHAATIKESMTAIDSEQIQTVGSRVERTGEFFDPPTDAEYHATEHLYVECVPEIAGQIVTEVTEAGGTIESVRFELHASTRQSLHDAALTAAMERAREKATCMAAVEGLEIDGVERVTTADGTVDENSELNLFGGSFVEDDANMVPKPIAVAGAVKVVYALSEE